jgi:hypothetical protein
LPGLALFAAGRGIEYGAFHSHRPYFMRIGGNTMKKHSGDPNAVTKRICWKMLALACVLVTSAARAAFVYDANADFVPNLPNPNGVWTYGYTPTLGGAFVPLAQYSTSSIAFFWETNLSANAPSIAKFTANANGALIGETTLHGGPNGEYCVLRFTTPVAGAYDVLASWRGPGDIGNSDLHLLLNSNSGSPLGFTNSTNTSGTIQLSGLLLNAGDTVDMSVGTLGSFLNDTTPVNLLISTAAGAVPEQSSLVVFGMVTVLGGFVARKKLLKQLGMALEPPAKKR